MKQQYRDPSPDQLLLLPPSLRDGLPEGHLVNFVVEVLTEGDLGPIERAIHAKDPVARGRRTCEGWWRWLTRPPRACSRRSAAFSALFAEVVRLCREAGLVKGRHVHLDGTKAKVNASKHKAMSCAGVKLAEER